MGLRPLGSPTGLKGTAGIFIGIGIVLGTFWKALGLRGFGALPMNLEAWPGGLSFGYLSLIEGGKSTS